MNKIVWKATSTIKFCPAAFPNVYEMGNMVSQVEYWNLFLVKTVKFDVSLAAEN